MSCLLPSGKNGDPDGKFIKNENYEELLLTKNEYFTCIKYDVKGVYQQDASKTYQNSFFPNSPSFFNAYSSSG